MSNSTDARSDGQFQSLLDTLERLRKEYFPQIDADLVREVLRTHSDAAASDSDLGRSTEQSVERRLTKDN